MYKTNIEATKLHFEQWWKRENKQPILSIYQPFTKFTYNNIDEYTDVEKNISNFTYDLSKKTYHSDCIPDISSYLGPGSLSTFLGAKPVYSNDTIWYESGNISAKEILKYMENPLKWYHWSTNASKEYVNKINDFRVSMPDLQQNLDILSALYSPEELLMKLIDDKNEIIYLLDNLYLFWEKCFMKHADILKDSDGYTSYGHYNIIGKGYTSVLQSDISIMLSKDMFDTFEMPYLIKQCEVLDRVLYHLDGPGAIRHLDSILSIDKIAAIQWVPGAGESDNADEKWYDLYDQILASGKGLYVYLEKEKIEEFLKRFGTKGIFIGTMVNNEQEELHLLNKINSIY